MALDFDITQAHLRRFGQEHLLAHWARLELPARQKLLAQIASIDLKQIQSLYQERDRVYEVPAADRIQPAPVSSASVPQEVRNQGEEALRKGEVAALVVPGGQGSRLGFDHPKGMFAIGPVTQRSLFQIHAEKVLALTRRHGKAIPLLVMTSPATDEETRQYFHDQKDFGLPNGAVCFFCQGTMPAVDLDTGKLLLEEPGQLFLSPDGHGGMLSALASSGLLRMLRDRGVRHLFYFQVDNPLVKIADRDFLGLHVFRAAEISSKIIPKEDPRDKLGNLVCIDGRCSIIEYSDLPEELGGRRTPDGKLWIWAGSPAIHIFDVGFLERMSSAGVRIPFHIARKKVPYLNAKGERVQPSQENALKFERFIFDLLPLADRWTVVQTSRAEEFMPVKNGSGQDSPETARQALSDQGASWLEEAGVRLPRRADGGVAIPVEISPLFALDAAELSRRLPPGWKPGDKEILLLAI